MENCLVKLTLLYTEAEAKMPYFKRDYYEQAFTKYCAVCDDIYKEIDEDTKDLSEEDLKAYLDNLASSYVTIFSNEFKNIDKKGKQTAYISNHNTPMVIYLFPGILNYNARWSKELCELIKTKWNASFTQMSISYGTYADIKSGFKTKLCYITTAVCQSLSMPEDCRELQLLKNYRDRELSNEEGGPELINSYYDIAPTIVKRINKASDSSAIYSSLYTDYISKCIECIEHKQYEECKDYYINMVNKLKEEYITNQR